MFFKHRQRDGNFACRGWVLGGGWGSGHEAVVHSEERSGQEVWVLVADNCILKDPGRGGGGRTLPSLQPSS